MAGGIVGGYAKSGLGVGVLVGAGGIFKSCWGLKSCKSMCLSLNVELWGGCGGLLVSVLHIGKDYGMRSFLGWYG